MLWTLPLLGVALLLLLAVDLFETVLHPHGRGGPVTQLGARVAWGAFRSIGVRRDGSPRHKLLSFAAPLIMLATLLVWLLLLVGGFTLIYYPWVATFLFSPGSLRGPWLEAFYYSGYTASTLGVGDMVADKPLLRVLTPVQAFGGFALLSASVTYYLGVLRELVRKRALAANIAGYLEPGPGPALDYVRHTDPEPLVRWLEQVASQLLSVLEAHYHYPVLHYFRPTHNTSALPVQLGKLLDLRDQVAADPDLDALQRHPSYRAALGSLEKYLRQVDRDFVPPDLSPRRHPERTDDLHHVHERLRRYLRYP